MTIMYLTDRTMTLWQDGGWDDSTQTPEEIQAKIQNKQEAALKRKRALAYAFSHQVRVPLHL